jgi:hypothetical protein
MRVRHKLRQCEPPEITGARLAHFRGGATPAEDSLRQ